MSHLRLVGNEPPKRPRRKGQSYLRTLLTPEERTRAAQAMRNLRDAFGAWSCLADAMGVPTGTLVSSVRMKDVSVSLLFAASRASGLTIDDLLSVPVPAGMCKACGQVKRYARAS
jgi:hypothetical protein